MRFGRLACFACSFAVAFASVVSSATPVASGAAPQILRLGQRVLAIGMHGTDVFHLQVLLGQRGFRVRPDRNFGPQTRAAVQHAQRVYGLVPDGVVGALTLSALRIGGAPRCASTPGAGDNVTRWLPVVNCVLGLLHASPTYASAVLIVIAHESAGNPNAINKWDVNAKRGDPSRGLMQVIGRVFVRYRAPTLPNNIYDPAANIYAALAYAVATYGSIGNIPGVKSVVAGRGYVPYKVRVGDTAILKALAAK